MGGFSHKLSVLVHKIGERAASLTFTDQQFEIQLDKARKELANWAFSQPYQIAAYDASVATSLPKWHIDERREAIADVSAGELRTFITSALLSKVHVTAFVCGNANEAEALAVADALV